MTQLGIEVFINEKPWKHRLENRRIGFLGHFCLCGFALAKLFTTY